MKSIDKYLILLLIGVLSACTLEVIDPVEESLNELVAIMEYDDAATRTHLEGPEGGVHYPYWSGNDQIAVYINDIIVAERFTLTSGENTRRATFAGAGKGKKYIALYPYGAQEKRESDTITLTLPEEQTYVPGSFAEGVSPMLAVSTNETLSFKNLCALLKVSITGTMSVNDIVFTANDSGMSVSGKATVRIESPDNPVLIMEKGGPASLSLRAGSVPLSDDIPTDFFFVLPPGIYKGGFTLKIKTSEGTVTKSTNQDIVFSRSQIRSVPPFACTGAEIDPDDLPSNMIRYTCGYPLYFSPNRFDRQIVSHSFENGIGTIIFDGPLKMIGNYCFSYTDVTEVSLPSSVESIGYGAFMNAINLNHFKVPEKIQTIGQGAFAGCESLKFFWGAHVAENGKAIVLNDSIVAFLAGNESVLAIPSGYLSLAKNCLVFAKGGRENLKEVILPEGLIQVEYGNLSDLPNLEYITLPSTLNSWAAYNFPRLPSLKKFLGPHPGIQDNGNIVVELDYGEIIAYAGAGIADYVIPEGVKGTSGDLFEGKPDLQSLTFPRTFKNVRNGNLNAPNLARFYGYGVTEDGYSLVIDGTLLAVVPVLEEYTSPEGATIISGNVFNGNEKIRKVVFNDCVTDIQCSFTGSYLETLILSASLKSVTRYCFSSSMKQIYFRSTVPPSCGSIFEGVFDPELVVYVPEESLAAYKSAPQWSFFKPYFKGYQVQGLPDNSSPDGNATILQRATEGAGLDLVLMGDAFSESQIADGTYGRTMQRLADAFFSVEPYKSFRHLFNVYRVDVVSQTSGYDQPGQRLGTWFGEGTTVGGDDQTCFRYASYAIRSKQLDDALIVVAMNSPKYAGTCYMYSVSDGDYGRGPAVAYFPIGETDEAMAQVLHHEAGGHGFAKLADEYAYESNGAIPTSTMIAERDIFQYGWWKNADFTDDPVAVKWSHFLKDARYRDDGLGCFEGAFTYWTGAWRPTENSIMRDNTGGFNAPSREAIWYRIHKLAYGSSWVYDYEEFVAYDAINRKASASTSSARSRRLAPVYPPLAPPVVINRRWNDPIPRKQEASRREESRPMAPDKLLGPVKTR